VLLLDREAQLELLARLAADRAGVRLVAPRRCRDRASGRPHSRSLLAVVERSTGQKLLDRPALTLLLIWEL
jgi:hypothetical protein